MPSLSTELLTKQAIGREGPMQGVSQKSFNLAVGHSHDSIIRFARRPHLAKVFESNVASGSDDLLKPPKIYIVKHVTLRVIHTASLPHIRSFVTTVSHIAASSSFLLPIGISLILFPPVFWPLY
jgi:hypothetical protein